MLSLVIIIPTHQRQNKNKTWHLKNLVTFVNIYIIICYMNIGEFGVARCRFNKWAVNGYVKNGEGEFILYGENSDYPTRRVISKGIRIKEEDLKGQ